MDAYQAALKMLSAGYCCNSKKIPPPEQPVVDWLEDNAETRPEGREEYGEYESSEELLSER